MWALRALAGVGLAAGFHVGIGLMQCVYVGADFIPCIPLYIFGLAADVSLFSSNFFLALGIGCSSMIWLVLTGGLVPVKWPSDPIPLFAYSGAQVNAMDKWRGDKRIVLAEVRAAF